MARALHDRPVWHGMSRAFVFVCIVLDGVERDHLSLGLTERSMASHDLTVGVLDDGKAIALGIHGVNVIRQN